jgi:hypothetical protein
MDRANAALADLIMPPDVGWLSGAEKPLKILKPKAHKVRSSAEPSHHFFSAPDSRPAEGRFTL